MDISARHIMTEVVRKSDLLIEIKGKDKEKLMQTLLDIMQDIHIVCINNNIKYGLVGGSALGAVRHKGFIPWDDDLDIAMSRNEFNHFKDIFENELGDKYILECPNYKKVDSKTTFAKIHKRGTDLWEVQDVALPPTMSRCIYIDLFIVENISDNKLIRKLDALISDFWKGACFSVIMWKYPSKIGKSYFGTTPKTKKYYILRRCLGAICSIIPHRILVNLYDDFVSRHTKETDFVTVPTGRKYYLGEMISRRIWEPQILMKFEDKEFYVPADVIEYVRNLYGNDFMQLPPEDKRERHFCVKLDFGDNTTVK